MSNNLKRNKSEWPIFYPNNLLVPPKDAVDVTGVFFRLTIDAPPDKGCFQTTHEEQPTRYKKYLTQPDILPNVYAVSFFDSYEAAEHMRNVFPDILGGKYVAKGFVTPLIGKMKKTGSDNHHSIWIRNNTFIHTSFTVEI